MVISGKSEVADKIFMDVYTFGVCLNPGRTRWLFCYLFKFMKMMIWEAVFNHHLFPLVYQWFRQGAQSR